MKGASVLAKPGMAGSAEALAGRGEQHVANGASP